MVMTSSKARAIAQCAQRSLNSGTAAKARKPVKQAVPKKAVKNTAMSAALSKAAKVKAKKVAASKVAARKTAIAACTGCPTCK